MGGTCGRRRRLAAVGIIRVSENHAKKIHVGGGGGERVRFSTWERTASCA